MRLHCRHCWDEVTPALFQIDGQIIAACPLCDKIIRPLKRLEIKDTLIKILKLPVRPKTPNQKPTSNQKRNVIRRGDTSHDNPARKPNRNKNKRKPTRGRVSQFPRATVRKQK
jgi:hypothetical protein